MFLIVSILIYFYNFIGIKFILHEKETNLQWKISEKQVLIDKHKKELESENLKSYHQIQEIM